MRLGWFMPAVIVLLVAMVGTVVFVVREVGRLTVREPATVAAVTSPRPDSSPPPPAVARSELPQTIQAPKEAPPNQTAPSQPQAAKTEHAVAPSASESLQKEPPSVPAPKVVDLPSSSLMEEKPPQAPPSSAPLRPLAPPVTSSPQAPAQAPPSSVAALSPSDSLPKSVEAMRPVPGVQPRPALPEMQKPLLPPTVISPPPPALPAVQLQSASPAHQPLLSALPPKDDEKLLLPKKESISRAPTVSEKQRLIEKINKIQNGTLKSRDNGILSRAKSLIGDLRQECKPAEFFVRRTMHKYFETGLDRIFDGADKIDIPSYAEYNIRTLFLACSRNLDSIWPRYNLIAATIAKHLRFRRERSGAIVKEFRVDSIAPDESELDSWLIINAADTCMSNGFTQYGTPLFEPDKFQSYFLEIAQMHLAMLKTSNRSVGKKTIDLDPAVEALVTQIKNAEIICATSDRQFNEMAALVKTPIQTSP